MPERLFSDLQISIRAVSVSTTFPYPSCRIVANPSPIIHRTDYHWMSLHNKETLHWQSATQLSPWYQMITSRFCSSVPCVIVDSDIHLIGAVWRKIYDGSIDLLLLPHHCLLGFQGLGNDCLPVKALAWRVVATCFEPCMIRLAYWSIRSKPRTNPMRKTDRW